MTSNRTPEDLSLVVIGRNTVDLLTKIYTSTYMSKIRSFFRELIYVDSASSDTSVSFMKGQGFNCFVINPKGAVTASAGRYIGAKESISKHILFLDSDMEIQDIDKFFCFISSFFKNNNGIYSGLVGDVVDRYADGRTRRRIRKRNRAGDATSFGGFVLLERKILIQAGGWNYRLSANEEVDLYARLREGGGRVCYSSEVSVIHYTEVPSPLYELLSIYIPLRPGRYGALGKVFRSHLASKRGWELLKLEFEAFAFAIFACSVFFSIKFALILFVIYQTVLLSRRGLRYNLVGPGLALSLVLGLFMPISRKSVMYEKV